MDEVRVDLRVPLARVGGVYAAWGLAVVDEASGQVLRRVRVEDGVVPEDGREATLVPWEEQQRLLQDDLEAFEALVPAVGCEVLDEWDAPVETTCARGEHYPRLISANMEAPGRYVFAFDRNTNQPAVATHEEVLGVLSFSTPIGARVRGEWTSPRHLLVEVVEPLADEGDGGGTDEAAAAPEPSFSVQVRQYPRPRSPATAIQRWEIQHGRADESVVFAARHRLRIGFEARLRLELFTSDARRPAARSAPLRFADCAQRDKAAAGTLDVLLHRPRAVSDGPPSGPVMVIEDTLALHASSLKLPRLSGSAPLPHWSQDFVHKAWSLSFWLAVDPAQPQDGLRAILYHGEGRGHETGLRTPSLWVLPESNKLALRVTTTTQADYGYDTEEDLPLGSWVHLAMVVRNSSDTGRFAINVYMDGQLAVRLNEPAASVLTGPGELYFAHDAWGSGVRGLVQHLQLFDRALDHGEILDDFEASRPSESDCVAAFQDAPSAPMLVDDHKTLEFESCDIRSDDAIATEFGDSASEDALNAGQDAEDGGASDPQTLFEHATARVPQIETGVLAQADALGHEEAAFVHAAWPWARRFFAPTQTQGAAEILPTSMVRAAMRSGSVEAKLALAEKWRRKRHCRSALAYYSDVSRRSLSEHTARGQQPLVEMQTLHDFVQDAGEKGEEDLNIQYFIGQAEVGDANAMVAVGNWYYWGSRGLARDHDRAFRYFERAANAGHAGAMTACGNMLLKGEGVPAKNLTAAVERYTRAAENDDQLAALNGLGYIYYFGHGDIAKNASKALEFFERNLRDGDSLYNAAHIYLYEPELRNLAKAHEYLRLAAENFDSVSAAHTLGQLLAVSSVTPQGCDQAVHFLRKSALRGSWGRRLRQGFDAYLEGDLERSLYHYLLAALTGYSRGAENALWLLGTPLRRLDRVPHAALFGRVERPMPPLQALLLGDVRHAAGDRDGARRAWVEASVNGDWAAQPTYRAQASYNLAMEALELGDLPRARTYLDRAEGYVAVEPAQQQAEDRAALMALRIARWRVWVKARFPKLDEWGVRLLDGALGYGKHFNLLSAD